MDRFLSRPLIAASWELRMKRRSCRLSLSVLRPCAYAVFKALPHSLDSACRRLPCPASPCPHCTRSPPSAASSRHLITVPLPSVRRPKDSRIRCSVLTHSSPVDLLHQRRAPESRPCTAAPVHGVDDPVWRCVCMCTGAHMSRLRAHAVFKALRCSLAFTCRRSPSPSSTRPHDAVPTERRFAPPPRHRPSPVCPQTQDFTAPLCSAHPSAPCQPARPGTGA
ncbi:hypothetical protein HYPSUDRAFT_202322 [Hypholoma sublateritium FD-334 SS-4]|uniref:Uncharacterized protein n=1 Tax=Hypholoma sublateritium (strain FD-334 SS-4) TaxID=945553 RepID=A0A0D2PR19_HYPSF|nr:hypothetical protein HYPSUDRAFT_202322 [Hypholoma sublateritium FD-334 SS-4]